MNDYAIQILSYLHPISLLHLARTTKSLRRFLLSRQRSKSLVWQPAFERLYQGEGIYWDAEPHWKGLSEPKFASLLFENVCQVCHLATTSHECPTPAAQNSRNVVSRLQERIHTAPLYCIRRYRRGFAGSVLSNSAYRSCNVTSAHVFTKVCVLGRSSSQSRPRASGFGSRDGNTFDQTGERNVEFVLRKLPA